MELRLEPPIEGVWRLALVGGAKVFDLPNGEESPLFLLDLVGLVAV